MTEQQEIAVVTLQVRWYGNDNYDVYVFSSVAEARQGLRQYFECPEDVTDFAHWLENDEDRLGVQVEPSRGYYEITTHQTLFPMPPQIQQLRQALSELVAHVDQLQTTVARTPDDLTMRAYYKLMQEGYAEDDVLSLLTDGAYQDVMSGMTIEAVQSRLQSFTESQREHLKGLDDEALMCAILYPKELVGILYRSEANKC